MKKKLLLLVGFTLLIIGVLVGCNNNSNGSNEQKGKNAAITAVGSSALLPLVQEAANQYIKDHQDAEINVQGGGSGTGLSQINQGTVDIGNSDIFAEAKDGIDVDNLVDHKVAVVGIAPVTHQGIGVVGITKQQLIDIFTGKITNWKDVGGNDQEIVVINRAVGSGTRTVFEKYGLEQAKVMQAQEQDSSGTVRKIVSKTPGAISYLAFSYFNDSVQPLKINQIEPTKENVETNEWMIWSYEHMYTNGEPEGLTKEFLDFMLDDKIQSTLITELGYIPVSGMKVDRNVDGEVTKK